MYKNYTTNQTNLLELSCLLSQNYIIFEIHDFIESIDNTLFSQYEVITQIKSSFSDWY